MSKSFRILHTEASVGWGGQEIRILQESQWLAQKGHKVFILCAPKSGIAERYAHRQIPNLFFSTIPFKRTLDPFDIVQIIQFIRKEKIDVVHTHSSIDSWTASAAAKITGVPIVRSRHVTIPIKDFFPRNLVYRFPDRFITSGKKIEEMVVALRCVSQNQMVSIPAGVDLERFSPNNDGSGVREEFGIPKDAVLVGKVAIIRGWKGHNDFIDAAEMVLKEKPDTYFMVVGSGPGFDGVKNIIREKKLEDRILMTGYREDVPNVISALNVLVLASRSGEATSQVIPQAWASRRCALATTAGGIKEIVRHEENGLLVPPRDPSGMAEAIRRLVDDPDLRSRLAEAGYSFAVKHLSLEKMMESTLAVYEELAGGKKGSNKELNIEHRTSNTEHRRR